MKKRFLILVPALLLSLTACDLNGLLSSIVNEDDDSDADISEDIGDESADESQDEGGNSYDDSIFNKPNSLEKFLAFGENTGFEITYRGSEKDYGGETIVFGMKGNVWWEMDASGYGTGYRLQDGVCSMLSYDSNTQSWSVFVNNVGETQFAEMFKSHADIFYSANEYSSNNGFDADGSGEYAGRDVLKFKYHFTYSTVTLDHEYYLDKDLGITIYNYISTTSDGETDWSKFETLSFKTGDDVTAITISE